MLKRHPLEVLAEEFSCRMRGGEAPTIEEYEARYPEYGKQIRSLFRPLVLLEKVANSAPIRSGGPRVHHDDSSPVPKTLGEFLIQREIGRGGMGVVYEAEQKSLKRRVALKVLAPSVAASPQERRRFEREAAAAAGLHHTNIVPVFGLGEHDGTLFYAMQWIDGVPMHRVIPPLHRFLRGGDQRVNVDAPSAEPAHATTRSKSFTIDTAAQLLWKGNVWRNMARLIAEVAEALHHAHEHGVLHRDIKPSNLLLDREGHIWIADFGLATHEDHESVTRTGDIVGTLRYMAPEQLAGHADARSDIYCLGLTFYELLTGRPAFEDTTHARLIQRKSTASVSRPRAANRSIPRDLETIALKACAAEPRQRYQRAAELAADLHRFLDDRPILARRAGRIRRLGHWARRNPSLAAAAALISTLLGALVVVSGVGNYRTRQALVQVRAEQTRAMASAEEAQQQGMRAEQNLQLALKAFQQIIANVSSRGAGESLSLSIEGIDTPPADLVVTPADTQLLETLLDFFGQFASTNGVDLDLQSADVWKTVGDIQQRLARLDEAADAYRRALAIYDAIPTRAADAQHAVLGRAKILNEMAVVSSRQGDVRNAVELHERASALLEEPPEFLQADEAQYELARTFNLLGSVGLRAGWANLHSAIASSVSTAEAGSRSQTPYRRSGSRSTEHRLHPLAPGDLERSGSTSNNEPVRSATSAGFRREPGTRRGVGRDPFQRIHESNQRALATLTGLVDRYPDNARYRLALAHCHQNLCRWDWRQARDESAQRAHETAIAVLEQLVADFPDAPTYRYELADTLALAVPPHPTQTSGTAAAARAARIARAIDIARQLHAEYPYVAEYQAVLASAASQLAAIHFASGLFDDAKDLLNSAATWQSELAQRHPAVVVYHLSYAQSLASLCEVNRSLHLEDEAQRNLQTAIESLRELELLEGAGRLARRMAERLERRQIATGG
jgi:serine/threonine protein kinase